MRGGRDIRMSAAFSSLHAPITGRGAGARRRPSTDSTGDNADASGHVGGRLIKACVDRESSTDPRPLVRRWRREQLREVSSGSLVGAREYQQLVRVHASLPVLRAREGCLSETESSSGLLLGHAASATKGSGFPP